MLAELHIPIPSTWATRYCTFARSSVVIASVVIASVLSAGVLLPACGTMAIAVEVRPPAGS